MQTALVTERDPGGALRLKAVGRWDIANAAKIDAELMAVHAAAGAAVRVDLSGLEWLDVAGAWLVHRTIKNLEAEGVLIELVGVSDAHAGLLRQVAENDKEPAPVAASDSGIAGFVIAVGAWTVRGLQQIGDFVAFEGLVVRTLVGAVLRPRQLRVTSLVYHMRAVGFDALPIVGLISFLIGVVLAYQGASQLRAFGATIFVVNLISLSVLRELGVLLTAIVVAGRSGSAFAAQIGSMKLREEIDAMRTLGIDPIEALVLPRTLALILTMPLLAFFSDAMGLLGGGIMSWLTLDITPQIFIQRLANTYIWHFLVGIIKAPVFGTIIGLIGCFEGLQVDGSAESVGQRTTRSVVEAIFLVIVVDAMFSIFFNVVHV
ncbi:MAG TPA: ABC transporter permease [Candidatus Cybelea sp.]|nr:ABC transporter permease [Candidatus Cybelea sp.]